MRPPTHPPRHQAAQAILVRLAKIAWASPCSAVGLFLAAMLVLAGGKARPASGTIEAVWRSRRALCGRRARRIFFRAITFGHVILAVTEEELIGLRGHERVHVRQYERWGLGFFLAYPALSLWQWLHGHRAYWDNPFEVQARSLAAPGQPDDSRLQGGAHE